MSEEDQKITKKVDKFIMGALIGGAIGSVLGITLAPKKGKETRAFLKKKSEEIIEAGKDVTEQFMEEHGPEIEKMKKKAVKEGRSFLTRIKDVLNSKKKIVTNSMKKIPTEHD